MSDGFQFQIFHDEHESLAFPARTLSSSHSRLNLRVSKYSIFGIKWRVGVARRDDVTYVNSINTST